MGNQYNKWGIVVIDTTIDVTFHNNISPNLPKFDHKPSVQETLLDWVFN